MKLFKKPEDCQDEGYGSFEEPCPLDFYVDSRQRWVSVDWNSEDAFVPQSSDAANLIPELLELVFGFIKGSKGQMTLSNCSQVSRHWRSVALAWLYAEPVLTTLKSVIGFSHIPKSLGRMVSNLNLKRVRLSESEHTRILKEIMTKCTHIRKVSLWVEALNLFTLQTIMESSPFLVSLSLAGHFDEWNDASPLCLSGFCKAVSRLEVIHFDIGYDGDSRRGLLTSLVSANIGPQLTHLHLAGCDHIETLKAICSAGHLKTLMFSWSSMSSQGLMDIAKMVPHLEVIDLRGCQKAVDPNSIKTLLQACPRLHSLDLSFTQGGDGVIQSLIQHGRRLNCLIMAGYDCSISVLVQLVSKHCLSILSLAWFEYPLDSLLPHLTNLVKLDCRGCKISTPALKEFMNKSKLFVFKFDVPPSAQLPLYRRRKSVFNEADFYAELKTRFNPSELVRIDVHLD